MAKASRSSSLSELRIIAGKYRGRKIAFHDAPGLRPTGDRIRETLFSWLQTELPGARCLDLFAGSGALGFEAASRGAIEVVMVENHAPTFRQLQSQQQHLHASEVRLLQEDGLRVLNTVTPAFDVIFLDPPFHQRWLEKALPIIAERQLLKPNGLIYLELERETDWPLLPASLEWHRQKEAGQVRYGLARQTGEMK
ncbi:16S rRNA (guanine(966)-N(2))-methyltransferase RsmD [Permianibacter aggregans]|nr:16S rRNA (guanine(966)-N(2))-methyltransferase RsmD [Permianibacter aggregans]QGX40417.1 16S rRNA (guanine(966)-N(2))-methyltransferase RsmD [Permianibacter aggregans]